MLDDLLAGFQRRDRLSLSRLLTLTARGDVGADIIGRLPAPVRPSRVVAFTGSGGVGKSSLIGKVIDWIRARGLSVAVLACDPQSSVSGGALLGDRFRMSPPAMTGRVDDGVFIRSLAALSGHGAVADHLDLMCRLLESFGFDVILLETVGAGQGDVAVRELADVVVLLLQPETGDDLQWEKAGVLEVADVVVVHKGDLSGADNVVAQVMAALELSHAGPTRVLKVSARTGLGLEELWNAMEACPLRRLADVGARRELLRLLQDTIAARFQSLGNEPRVNELVDGWRHGSLSSAEVADKVIRILAHP
jgi:LAO/AO transport system ATPase